MSKRYPSRKSCLSLAVLAAALCAPTALAKPTVIIANPMNGSAVSGKDVSVVISYASEAAPVTAIEILLDGQSVHTKRLASPSQVGSERFTFDTTVLTDSTHTLAVKAYDSRGESASALVTVYVSNQTKDTFPPTVVITKPRHGETVSGPVEVAMNAHDNKLLQFVNLFIDGTWKYFANAEVGLFRYVWDTTRADNGAHTLLAKATDAERNEGVSPPVVVTVNNEGGKTRMPSPFRDADQPPSAITPVAPEAAPPDVKSFITDPGTPPSPQTPVAPTKAPVATTKEDGATAPGPEAAPSQPPVQLTTPSVEAPTAGPRVEAPPVAPAKAPVGPVLVARGQELEAVTKSQGPALDTPPQGPRPETPRSVPQQTEAGPAAAKVQLPAPKARGGAPQTTTVRPPNPTLSAPSPAAPGVAVPNVPAKAETSRPTSEGKTTGPTSSDTAAVGEAPRTDLATATVTEPGPAAVQIARPSAEQLAAKPTAPAVSSPEGAPRMASADTRTPSAPSTATSQKPSVSTRLTPAPPTTATVAATEPPTLTRVAMAPSTSTAEPPTVVSQPAPGGAREAEPRSRPKQVAPTPAVAKAPLSATPEPTTVAVSKSESVAALPRTALAPTLPTTTEPTATQPSSTSSAAPAKTGRVALAPEAASTLFPDKPLAFSKPAAGPAEADLPHARGRDLAVPAAGPSTVRDMYTVKPGDNLTLIARRFDVSIVDIALSNNLKDTRTIQPGHRLVIPNRSLQVFYDNHAIKLDVAAFAKAGIPLAPFRPIFEHAGGTVVWVHKDKAVEAKKDRRTVRLQINSQTAYIDGEAVLMELAALIKGNRTMVPTSLFTKALDVEVQFDAETGSIMIASK